MQEKSLVRVNDGTLERLFHGGSIRPRMTLVLDVPLPLGL